MPPPAKKQGKTSPQWCRPGVNTSPEAFLPPAAIGEIRGVRPISPHITTSVSSSRPRCCQVVEEAAQAVVERRQQLPLQVAEGVLVRVPAAQVDLHHAHARLDQPPGDEEALPPLLAAVEVADAVGLLGQVERVLAARTAGQQQLHGLLAVRVPGVERAGRVRRCRRRVEARRAGRAARSAPERRRARGPRRARSGRWNAGVAATAVVPPRLRPLAGGALGVVRVVVAEAVGARAGRVGRAARRREIDAPAVVPRPEHAGAAAGIAHLVRPRQLDHGGQARAWPRRRGVGDQRADRRPLEPARPRAARWWRWCRPAGISVVPVCSR